MPSQNWPAATIGYTSSHERATAATPRYVLAHRPMNPKALRATSARSLFEEVVRWMRDYQKV